MKLEYEYNFHYFDKKTIIKAIVENGGYKKGSFLFKIIVFHHPTQEPNTYIRIRDEGHRVTMTFKSKGKSEFSHESEVIINDFNQGVQILKGLGCTVKYYYEKIREIYHLGMTEVDFNQSPGIPETLEIESKNKKELDRITKLVGLDKETRVVAQTNLYEINYGFVIPKEVINLTFANAKTVLMPYIKKNKPKFLTIIKNQNKLIKQL